MTSNNKINAEVLSILPVPDEAMLDNLLKQEIAASNFKIVVLDDDPTGVQTVHGISVYTDWSVENMIKGFNEQNKLFYILTNSRGFTAGQTKEAHAEIAENLWQASIKTGKPFLLMSRSDSTMRGHYPLETEILRESLESRCEYPFNGEILCFFFKEGGRYTINNVHYVRYGDELIPAGETEFAQDKSFGYKSSDLREYIEEKTRGNYPAKDVAVVSLEDLRAVNLDAIERTLLSLSGFSKLIVNAADYCDMKVFCIAMYRAIAKGRHFLLRTAAALVKVAGGISDKALLSREELVSHDNRNGGIVLIGSHVNKTTRQLDELRKDGANIVFVEFNQHLVLEDGGLEREAVRVTKEVESYIQGGKTAVVYTRRDRFDLDTDDKDEQIAISVRISDAVTSVIGNLTVCPSFIVAKGGITSSDVGVKALRVNRALVIGQILPGVPVWQTGPESKFPGLPYIIFPGNVGDDQALRAIVQSLQQYRKE